MHASFVFQNTGKIVHAQSMKKSKSPSQRGIPELFPEISEVMVPGQCTKSQYVHLGYS